MIKRKMIKEQILSTGGQVQIINFHHLHHQRWRATAQRKVRIAFLISPNSLRKSSIKIMTKIIVRGLWDIQWNKKTICVFHQGRNIGTSIAQTKRISSPQFSLKIAVPNPDLTVISIIPYCDHILFPSHSISCIFVLLSAPVCLDELNIWIVFYYRDKII